VASAFAASVASVGANGKQTIVAAAHPSHVTCSGDARASTGFWMTAAAA